MAKEFYTDMQLVASNVLREFDQSKDTGAQDDGLWYIEMKKGVGGSPAEPAPAVPTPHKVDGAARGVSFKFIDGTNIVASDLQCTIAINPDVNPSLRDFIDVDGKRHKIVAVRQIPPVGVPVATVLIFREG